MRLFLFCLPQENYFTSRYGTDCHCHMRAAWFAVQSRICSGFLGAVGGSCKEPGGWKPRHLLTKCLANGDGELTTGNPEHSSTWKLSFLEEVNVAHIKSKWQIEHQIKVPLGHGKWWGTAGSGTEVRGSDRICLYPSRKPEAHPINKQTNQRLLSPTTTEEMGHVV